MRTPMCIWQNFRLLNKFRVNAFLTFTHKNKGLRRQKLASISAEWGEFLALVNKRFSFCLPASVGLALFVSDIFARREIERTTGVNLHLIG